MIVSGIVYDSTNHIGMRGLAVKAYTRDDPNTILGSTITDSQGNFKLTFSVDISIFATQTISVTTDVPNGYMDLIEKSQPHTGFGIWMYVPELTNNKLCLFKKTELAVTFQRTYTDLFSEMESTYRYSDWYNYGLPIIKHTTNLSNPLIHHIETAAGTFTKIWRTKKLPSGGETTFRDSIFCLPDVTNSITIDY